MFKALPDEFLKSIREEGGEVLGTVRGRIQEPSPQPMGSPISAGIILATERGVLALTLHLTFGDVLGRRLLPYETIEAVEVEEGQLMADITIHSSGETLRLHKTNPAEARAIADIIRGKISSQ
ncbi:MAG: PH domain-containing protein [bacterium]